MGQTASSWAPSPSPASFHDETDSEEVLRVRMPVGTARAFTKRTREVVGAGRPICVICGQPIDPDGHTCTFPES